MAFDHKTRQIRDHDPVHKPRSSESSGKSISEIHAENREIRRHLVAVLASAGVTQLLVATVYILSARSASPDRYGPVAAGAAVAMLAGSAVDFGGATYMVRELAAGRGQEYQSWLYSKLLIGAVVALPIGAIAALVGARGAWTAANAAWLAVLFCGAIWSFLFAIPLRVNMRFGTISLIQVISRAPSAIVALLLQSAHRLVPELLVPLLALAYVLEALMYVVSNGLRNLSGMTRGTRLVNPYTGSGRIGLNATISSMSSLDAAVITATAGNLAAGQFAGVSKWTAPIGLVSTAISQTMFPRMSRARRDQRARLLAVSLGYLGLALPILLAVAIFAPIVVRVLLGGQYAESVGVLRVLCVALIFAMANQPLNSTLIAWGEEHAATVVLFGSMVVQLASQAMLAAGFGAIGAAWGAAVGQLLCLMGYAWVVYRISTADPLQAVVQQI